MNWVITFPDNGQIPTCMCALMVRGMDACSPFLCLLTTKSMVTTLQTVWVETKLEIEDQWSTRIPPPHRRGWQWAMGGLQFNIFQNHRQPFWKRHSWQSLGFCLQSQRTSTWNLKLKFQSKLELRCRNNAIQKPKNLIWPPGNHLENEVTENW